MDQKPKSDTINVAVIGGGMGGLCLAIGLLKYPHINVQIYEAAHKFSEIGAGVAFGPNAQRALRLIGDNTEQAYLRQATHNGWKEMENVWFEYLYGEGDQAGQVITTVRNETGQATVHRAKFLDEFVALVPKEIAHFGKRLTDIIESDDGVRLQFKDGTSEAADCVIGCDGIHSVVRSHLLGADNPKTHAQFTGSVAYRGLVPMPEACDALGERFAQNSFILVGHGAMIMTYPIDFGKTLNIVAINSSYESWEGAWVQKADYSKIAQEFAHWSPLALKVIGLLDRPETSAWSMWDLPNAPTYFHGNIAMLGDAAHASTPFQGQGAGQAIEDAFVMQSLFSHVDTKEKISMAFKAYDMIRRPRSQKVCSTSREAGEMASLRLESVKDNAEAFKENVEWRMDWMWHRDVALEAEQANLILRKLVDGERVD